VNIIALRVYEDPEEDYRTDLADVPEEVIVDCEDERISESEHLSELIDEAVEDGQQATTTVSVAEDDDIFEGLPVREGSVYVECEGMVFDTHAETLQ